MLKSVLINLLITQIHTFVNVFTIVYGIELYNIEEDQELLSDNRNQ